MEINAENPKCLTPEEQFMNGTEFEPFLHRYVLPAVTIFGIVGNCLNLFVLLSMRNRLNTFLSLLAFADIVFLILLWPNILVNISFFTFRYAFRYFYYWTRVHILAIANWSSAIATWCVIAVCTERLNGTVKPLYVRKTWPRWQMPLVLGAIVFPPFLLTIYQHFDYACRTVRFCNGTQILQRCLKVSDEKWFANSTNPYRLEYRRFMDFSLHLYVDSMILFPIFLLSILNFFLIFVLRRRRKNIMRVDEQQQCSTVLSPRGAAELLMNARASPIPLIIKTEHRVTLTVVLIVTTFTVTNGPSALLQITKTALGITGKRYYDMMIICNVLVIFGKASNFILFCFGSKHFRRRLLQTLIMNRLVKRLLGNAPPILERWIRPKDSREGLQTPLRPSVMSLI